MPEILVSTSLFEDTNDLALHLSTAKVSELECKVRKLEERLASKTRECERLRSLREQDESADTVNYKPVVKDIFDKNAAKAVNGLVGKRTSFVGGPERLVNKLKDIFLDAEFVENIESTMDSDVVINFISVSKTSNDVGLFRGGSRSTKVFHVGQRSLNSVLEEVAGYVEGLTELK